MVKKLIFKKDDNKETEIICIIHLEEPIIIYLGR